MGNKDPYVQFNPDNRVFWASHTGLSAMDDKELDAMYQKAHKFFIERINMLIKEHKWRELDMGNRQVTSILPLQFRSICDTSLNIVISFTFGRWLYQQILHPEDILLFPNSQSVRRLEDAV